MFWVGYSVPVWKGRTRTSSEGSGTDPCLPVEGTSPRRPECPQGLQWTLGVGSHLVSEYPDHRSEARGGGWGTRPVGCGDHGSDGGGWSGVPGPGSQVQGPSVRGSGGGLGLGSGKRRNGFSKHRRILSRGAGWGSQGQSPPSRNLPLFSLTRPNESVRVGCDDLTSKPKCYFSRDVHSTCDFVISRTVTSSPET